MRKIHCPTCGREVAPDGATSGCEHPANNGETARRKPAPSPEAANWVIESMPPEVA